MIFEKQLLTCALRAYDSLPYHWFGYIAANKQLHQFHSFRLNTFNILYIPNMLYII